MSPGPLLLFAALCPLAGLVIGPRLRVTWLALTLLGALAAVVAAGLILLGAPVWEWRSNFLIGGEPLHFRLDGLSALFIALLAVVGGSGAAYAHEYWHDRDRPQSAPRGRRWWSAMTLSLGVVLLSSNGLHFLIAWELFALSAFFLITLDRGRREVRAAGWLYLAASHTGTLCLFAFFATLASRTGSWELGPMRDHAGLAPLFWLALAGFGLKAGMFPLHIWLPSAHANAPSHVSALMSGVAIKMGVYGLVRFTGWLPAPAAAGWTLAGLGAVGALLGIAFAFAQTDLKRLLAYCSVENIGIIFVGLGFALIAERHGPAAAAWGRLALAGALLHVWNHGLFKSLLFFGAGSVLHATGTREMSRLGGLWRAMPWTAALFAVGAVAISGLPPLNGFVSEWLVYLGLLDAVTGHGSAAWAAMPAIILLGTTGALAVASFVKAGSMIFLGAPRTAPARHAHECRWWMRGPMLTLAVGCAVLGLAPAVFWPALTRAVGVWHPVWSASDTPAPLVTLGWVQLSLAVAASLAAAGLWWLARANGLRRALTWDCGYAAPTAHMQYTAGSFAGIGAGWFAWVLQPERRLRRPRGLFPADAIRLERTPETVLERIVGPVAAAIMRASTAVRRLQHGHLQYYIAYLLMGLSALGTLVALGSKP
jgi:hydrogenase-4 component B